MKSEEVFNQLLSLYRENKLSHVYLIETNNVDLCFNDLKKLIKNIFCLEKYSDTCNKCNLCNLIDTNNLPSLITIEPDGKNIKKDVIDDLKKRFSNKPIYTDNNIYIIKYPEKMNSTSFNRMLKFIEEPDDSIIGFLITENSDQVASTIFSRCELLKIYYSANDDIKCPNDNIMQIAQNYYDKLKLSTSEAIWYNNDVILKEITSHDELVLLFNYLLKIFNTSQIKQKRLISNYLEKLNYNVNTSLLLDSFVIEMRNINE